MHNSSFIAARRLACFLAAAFLAQALGAALPTAYAQDDEGPQLSFYGFVKSEYIYDSRQVANVREGEFNLYPLPDSEANETDNLGFFTFFSRLGFVAAGPQVLGAEAEARIEADFFGASNENTSTFRLRRAFVNLDWGTHEVLFGQEWSPLFTIPVFPPTVNTQAGTPFNPFARQPMVRLTLKPGNLRVIGALAQQRDAFQEIGGNKLQQQAGLPAAHLHVRYQTGGNLVGGGAYVKWIRPELTSDRFRAGAVQAYGKLATERVTLAAKGTFGNDLADHLMLGGFVTTQDGEFYPTQLTSGWVDVSTTGAPVSVGLFGGYMRQTGVGDDILSNLPTVDTDDDDLPDAVPTNTRALSATVSEETGIISGGSSIEYLWRLAPRLVHNAGPVRFGLEIEATTALYTSSLDDDLTPNSTDDDDPVTNIRGIVSVFYFF